MQFHYNRILKQIFLNTIPYKWFYIIFIFPTLSYTFYNQKCCIFLQNRNDNDRVIPSIHLGIKFSSFLSSSHNTRERISRPLRRRKDRAAGLTFDIATISPNIVVTDNQDNFVYREASQPWHWERLVCHRRRGRERGERGWNRSWRTLLRGVTLEVPRGEGVNSAVRAVCRVFRYVRGWADQYCDWTPEANFIQSTPPFHPPSSGLLEVCYYTAIIVHVRAASKGRD